MSTCENCGTRLNGGICSNCHEEAYILEYQSEYITEPVSDEFAKKAQMQQTEINENRKSATHTSGRRG